ncbi:MAG: MoaD/ThiS family protein [Oligoflexia bacterium]|nr:MoaD/ThiS family protein [Oligoflexia bacterium]
MIRIRVKLFGAFRQLGTGPEVSLEAPRGTTVSELRALLAQRLTARPGVDLAALLQDSVIADNARILAETHALEPSSGEAELAILPPVCGG